MNIITTFLLLCIVSCVCCQCPSRGMIDSLHKVNVDLEMMNSMTTSTVSYHSYRYSYPGDIQAAHVLVYVHDVEWTQPEDRNHISWSIGAYPSGTQLTLVVMSEGLAWKILSVGLVFADAGIEDTILFGTEVLKGNSQTTISKALTLPHHYEKHVSFITGMDITSTNKAISEFHIMLHQSVGQNQLTLTLTIGSSNELNTATVAYIVFNDDALLKNEGSFTFSNVVGSVYGPLTSEIPITEWYVFGIGGLKFKAKDSGLGISFGIIGQYVLEVKVQHVLMEYLKVRFFGVSSQPTQICSECEEKLVYSSGWENYCVQECPTNTWRKSYGEGSGCVECPSQLHIRLNSKRNGCECETGFIPVNGRCISYLEQITNSQEDEDQLSTCQGVNEVSKSGQCQCKDGYERDSSNTCVNMCGNGYITQFGCQVCAPGNFGIPHVGCQPCTQHCEFCASENTCGHCSAGFKANSIGECVDFCEEGQKYNNNNGAQYCTTINYQMMEQKQTLGAGKLETSYHLSPGKMFSTAQLRNMCSVLNNDLVCGVYQRQNSQHQLTIVLDFCNQIPIFDVDISMVCRVGMTEIPLLLTTQIYVSWAGVVNSVFEERNLQ